MGLFNVNVPVGIAYLALLTAGTSLYSALSSARWKRLQEPTVLSAWCMAVILMPMIWRFRIPVASGLDLHLLGLSLFALMFGRQLGMLGMALSVVAYTAVYDGLWSNLGLNLLLLAVLPAWCSDAVLRVILRFFPHHIFVYLIGNGFFGSLVVLSTTDLISLAAYKWLGMSLSVTADLIPYTLLLAWGEAFLMGFLLTIFTVYRPQWVWTFDDAVYLYEK
ncbi:MAG TPA: energy-coupling factor ABC transporter permease [Burkholderiaceae bacterium]|nr:energy-coupling factor ABC transporter permease [Burkholderiaceae bacterium]